MSTWLTYASKAGKNAKSAGSGDVVTVFDENKKRLEWRTAVIESLVKGKDDVVKGANIRVIVKRSPYACPDSLKNSTPLKCEARPHPKYHGPEKVLGVALDPLQQQMCDETQT